jgi:hypothetical protein
MRAFLLSTLALGALTSAALAEEALTLTDSQMDSVVAAGSPGDGIDNAYTKINSNNKNSDNTAVTDSSGAPYSTGGIGWSGPQDTSKPRGNGDVYPGWGTQTAPGQQ